MVKKSYDITLALLKYHMFGNKTIFIFLKQKDHILTDVEWIK